MKRVSHIVFVMVSLALMCRGAESRLVVAVVDGSPITKEEFCLALAPFKASLHWLHERNSIAALDSSRRILDQALERSIETKVRQLLAKEHALLQDVSYDAFHSALQRENEYRRVAHKNGKVFYGPKEFTELAFFDYQLGNIEASLKKLLAKDFGGQLRARRARAHVEVYETVLSDILNQLVKREL